MSNTSAYSYPINPISGDPNDNDVHQVNPTWVLTFVRYNIRDTLRTHVSPALAVRQQVVVESDCINVSVSVNKGSLTPSMQATLVQTDINYETAIGVGDFVFVNMLNYEFDARATAIKAKAGQPINEIDDGFKGMFKVQSIRKDISVDPQSGTRTVKFNITGFGFTEFNNTIYFNPNLINQKNLDNQALYISDISTAWKSFATLAGKPPVQELLAFLIQNLIGSGINPKAANVNGLVISPNNKFAVPPSVGKFLGIVTDDKPGSTNYSSVKSAAQLYSYVFGLQQYSGAANSDSLSPSIGLNPSNLQSAQKYPNFYYTSIPCPGHTILKAEYWNQVKVWSILQQYVNAPLNELYTCFKVNKANRIVPTVVFRQIPFSSDDFQTQTIGPTDTNHNNKNTNITKFMSLPRWVLNPAMVSQADLGRDEAARINFVQFFAKSAFTKGGIDMAQETAKGNYFYDPDDIKRSGLRPYVIQGQFEDLPNAVVNAAPVWARIIADAVIGGHLKMNGSILCNGIVDPITVGDNLEFDGTVYHIEQISHNCSINPAGMKTFRTNISVSHGVNIASDASGTVYAEMHDSNAYLSRKDDYARNNILPGVSENQDTQYRTPNVEYDPKIGAGGTLLNNPFDQPNKNANSKRTQK